MVAHVCECVCLHVCVHTCVFVYIYILAHACAEKGMSVFSQCARERERRRDCEGREGEGYRVREAHSETPRSRME